MLKEVVSSVMLKKATPEQCKSQIWACYWKYDIFFQIFALNEMVRMRI